MDASQISIVATSLSMARDITRTIIGIRDANLIAEKVTALNDQLLKAQEALLAHNAAMFQLQNQYFEAREELRKLQEAASEQGRYTLFELVPGKFAYRVNIAPEQSGSSEPGSAEPMHYVCQICFDQGRKAVLRIGTFVAYCPLCKDNISLSQRPAEASPSIFSDWGSRDW